MLQILFLLLATVPNTNDGNLSAIVSVNGEWITVDMTKGILGEGETTRYEGIDAEAIRLALVDTYSANLFMDTTNELVFHFANTSNIGNATGQGGEWITAAIVTTIHPWETQQAFADRTETLVEEFRLDWPQMNEIPGEGRMTPIDWLTDNTRQTFETELIKPYPDPGKWKPSKNGSGMVQIYKRVTIKTPRKSGESDEDWIKRHEDMTEKWRDKDYDDPE